MRVLTDGFVDRYAGRMLNVPSVAAAVLSRTARHISRRSTPGVRLHGACGAFRDVAARSRADRRAVGGARHGRRRRPRRSPRACSPIEHIIYPRAVRWFVEGRLAIDGLRVTLTPPEPQWLFRRSHRRGGRMRLHGFLIGQTETLLADVLRLVRSRRRRHEPLFPRASEVGPWRARRDRRGGFRRAAPEAWNSRICAESGSGSPARRLALLGLMQTAGCSALQAVRVRPTSPGGSNQVAKIDPASLPLRDSPRICRHWIYQTRWRKRFEARGARASWPPR